MSDTRRSWEFAAVPLTIVLLGVLAMILWAYTQGPAIWVAVGALALVALIAIAAAYMARPHHPHLPATPALPEGAAPHIQDDVHRILVIADDACASDQLRAAIAGHGGGRRMEAFVIAPPLGSRAARWSGDERAYVEAGKHLEATVSAFAELSIDASGRVGSHDPVQAAEDGLREFPADEIIFAVHTDADANWLERGVVEDARVRYPIPVQEVTLGVR